MYIEWLFAISSSLFLLFLAFLLLDRSFDFEWYTKLRSYLDQKTINLIYFFSSLRKKILDNICHSKKYLSIWNFLANILLKLARLAHLIEKKLIKAAKEASSKKGPSDYLKSISSIKN